MVNQSGDARSPIPSTACMKSAAVRRSPVSDLSDAGLVSCATPCTYFKTRPSHCIKQDVFLQHPFPQVSRVDRPSWTCLLHKSTVSALLTTSTMLGSVLPFSEEVADRVSEYCETRSTPLPDALQKHWEDTRGKFSDAEKMSSRLQGAWMVFTAKDRKPKRGMQPIVQHLGFLHLLTSLATQFWRSAASAASAPWRGTRAPRTRRPRSSRWSSAPR